MTNLTEPQATFLQKILDDDYPMAHAELHGMGASWAVDSGLVFYAEGAGGSIITRLRLTQKGRDALVEYIVNEKPNVGLCQHCGRTRKLDRRGRIEQHQYLPPGPGKVQLRYCSGSGLEPGWRRDMDDGGNA